MQIIIIFFIGFIAYMLFRRQSLLKQVDTLNRLLYAEKSPEKYIEEVDRLLRRIQPERERNINLIQKTTGLLYAGRFQEAISILTEGIKKLPPNWQHIYYHNLILCLFFNGDTDKANETLEEAGDVMGEYGKREYNKPAIDFVYAVADYYNGKGSERKSFFEDISKNGRNDYRMAFGYYFLSKLYRDENDEENSALCMEQAHNYGQGSFVEHLS